MHSRKTLTKPSTAFQNAPMRARGFSLFVAILTAMLVLTGCGGTTGARAKDRPFVESTSQPAGDALKLQGWVSDAAGVLDAAGEEKLATRLAALEKATHHQMVVVTTPSLGGRDIGAYTLQLARRWGIGRQDWNDGVVILLAPNDRKVRIEVGSGLEKALPDAFCKQVIEQEMLPRFKRNDFVGGLERGVAAVSRKIGQP